MSMITPQAGEPLPFPVATASFAAALSLAACAGNIVGPSESTLEFGCSGGKGFQARVSAGAARVVTSAGAYLLHRRPSSVGWKFSSDDVTLIVDEDRGALVGAAGGPFRDCRGQ